MSYLYIAKLFPSQNSLYETDLPVVSLHTQRHLHRPEGGPRHSTTLPPILAPWSRMPSLFTAIASCSETVGLDVATSIDRLVKSKLLRLSTAIPGADEQGS
jgi:hypothetical protein